MCLSKETLQRQVSQTPVSRSDSVGASVPVIKGVETLPQELTEKKKENYGLSRHAATVGPGAFLRGFSNAKRNSELTFSAVCIWYALTAAVFCGNITACDFGAPSGKINGCYYFINLRLHPHSSSLFSFCGWNTYHPGLFPQCMGLCAPGTLSNLSGDVLREATFIKKSCVKITLAKRRAPHCRGCDISNFLVKCSFVCALSPLSLSGSILSLF